MDLTAYRHRPIEQARVASLLGLVDVNTRSVLDVGARDGYLSCLLADRVPHVVALDLEQPAIDDSRVVSIAGDATALPFTDRHFDLVFCAEVLEHIPEPALGMACKEMMRVARSQVIIGVPFRQDIRNGRCTCGHCGHINPPWGHVNRFDEARLGQLFAPFEADKRDFVGVAQPGTNRVSSRLMDFAGNPFGTYEQEEPCISCGRRMHPPAVRTASQRLATRAATVLQALQALAYRPHPNWIHVRFMRRS